MKSERVIETISNALRDHSAVRGLFLSGSFGNGRADAYSDIDFVLVSEDGPPTRLPERGRPRSHVRATL